MPKLRQRKDLMPTPTQLPKKILLLESGTGPGGSVNFLRDLIPFLDSQRVQPFVGLYFPNPSLSLEEIRRQGVPVTFFRSRPANKPAPHRNRLAILLAIGARLLMLQLPLALAIARFIRKKGIDLVVFNQDIHFHLPGLLAAKLARVPCVCRKAGGIGEAKRLKRVITPWVDLFVSISEATDYDQRNTPGTRKLVKIHEGVDLERFRSLPSKEAMRRELGLPEGKKVVATISRIEEGKGHIEFLRMAAEVVPCYPEVVFLIVGDQGPEGGNLLDDLKALTRQLKLAEHVVFTGWRNDVPRIMAAVDIFVHCPTTFIEGLARTCVEAMAMRLPCVISDNGGMADAVVDGVTGFLVPPSAISAMAQAVLRLLRDEELCRKQGLHARLRVEQLFDISQNARRLEDALLACASAPTYARRIEETKVITV
jgi:glycosyltransferase involved in cell wall biosynthesis